MAQWRMGEVAWRRIGSETIVLHLARKRAYGLNETGGAVWEAVVSGAVVAPRAGDPDAAGLQSFLLNLEQEGLISRTEDRGDDAGAAVALALEPPAAISWSEEITTLVQYSCAKYPDGSCSSLPSG